MVSIAKGFAIQQLACKVLVLQSTIAGVLFACFYLDALRCAAAWAQFLEDSSQVLVYFFSGP